MSSYLAIGVWPVVREQGWGLLPFRGDKVHYFHRGALTAEGGRFAYSTCGMRGAETVQVPLLVPGNFPRCRRCADALPAFKRYA
ncbi:hypothetical protein [Bordetella sp. BOR01]|uniref:hypothetical protein n=1 Tax=Bordetella sp. BOR01 TaxID=2854779 RepID=UPI001C493E6A|nr:hypothetical protein [Bordetella sp. BOR01]MBV7482506.1 hypothetical protein [Bordetella sp. BOR01]